MFYRKELERFIDSLTALGERGQRTVYRLTLVKSYNAEDVDGYAKLVSLGYPDFIEIKGVTYCGTSMTQSNLTMKNNVPYHEEVVKFGQDLLDRVNQIDRQNKVAKSGSNAETIEDLYGFACEHEHSNCILLAHKKFNINNQWNTWIDYERFYQLITKYYQTGETFSSLDYVCPTPHWAVYGAQERGFNPNDTRFRKGK